MQRSAANCPPLSWTGSVISLFWKQKTDDLRAYVVILDLEYIHMWQAVNHSLCKANICLWSTLSNSLSVWKSVWMYLFVYYVCITCARICMLSTVGTGVLICTIIIFVILRRKKKGKKETVTLSHQLLTGMEQKNKQNSHTMTPAVSTVILCPAFCVCNIIKQGWHLWQKCIKSWAKLQFFISKKQTNMAALWAPIQSKTLFLFATQAS